MIDVILDASVVGKWFKRDEALAAQARRVRHAYERGEIAVTVPSLLFLELLNVAARGWGWSGGALHELVERLSALRFSVREPDLGRTASWAGRRLTAYDAAYVALAEQTRARLVTDDRQVRGGRPCRCPTRHGRATLRGTTYGGDQVSTWSVLRMSCKPRTPVGLVKHPGNQ